MMIMTNNYKICKTVKDLREFLERYSDDTLILSVRLDGKGYDNTFVIEEDNFIVKPIKEPNIFDGDYDEKEVYDTSPSGTIKGLRTNL